jgi:hypothetical protein
MDIYTALADLSQGDHEKYAVASDADIQLTETAIGIQLPVSYRTFVKQFSNGAYLYMLQEVSSVGHGNSQISAIQNVVPDTSGGAGDESIPNRDGGTTNLRNLIPFSLDSNGNASCFITGSEATDDLPVAYIDFHGRKLYAKLPSFEEWLSIFVSGDPEEVIRKVCDESIIDDELCLG